MKKVIIVISLVFMFMLAGNQVYAQASPPAHNQGIDQSGGGAPIGGGLFILLGLGVAYGGKKLYQLNKERLEE